MNYCINQEEALKVFLNDGEVPLDNNVTEGALRSFCLHKHAWKLIDSIDGAKSSANIYSITETAKANNLNPFRYLPHILTVLNNIRMIRITALLKNCFHGPINYRRSVGANLKQLICKPDRRKWRSKNGPVLMVYRIQIFSIPSFLFVTCFLILYN
ncbi:transposase [Blautia pseudococcoides]|uniref:IS66 family transposase n=1 Tax=Blautia pseudococcoides TaxID=1796616 RepID=UPI002433AB23|nr:transposase [Blautia pseudococcoides]